MGAPERAARSSPIAIGWPPSTLTACALPPAASIRSQTQSQERASAGPSPPAVETDGIRSHSSSSSRSVGIGQPFWRK